MFTSHWFDDKNLVGVEARPSKDKMAQIHVTVKIQNLSHLKPSLTKLKVYQMFIVFVEPMGKC